MRLSFILMLSSLFVLIMPAQAQYMGAGISASANVSAGMYGSGMWGGQQSCPYGPGAAGGVSSEEIELREAQAELKEEQRQLKKYLKQDKKDVESARKGIQKNLITDVAEAVFQHLEDP